MSHESIRQLIQADIERAIREKALQEIAILKTGIFAAKHGVPYAVHDALNRLIVLYSHSASDVARKRYEELQRFLSKEQDKKKALEHIADEFRNRIAQLRGVLEG